MLRWYWYLCGAAHVKQTWLLQSHELEDYEKWRSALVDPNPGSKALPWLAAHSPPPAALR
jgi:hypothetical protein